MPAAFRQALVGLGANLGNRELTLSLAVDRLRTTPGIRAIVPSPIYESEPVGLTEQPRFLNLVVGLETSLTPERLLAVLQQIENEFGRVRVVRWGPRTLDLDLLAYEGETRDSEALTLPHPRMTERAFVMVPLRDVLRAGAFAGSVWDALRAQAIRRLPDERGVVLAGSIRTPGERRPTE